MKLNKNPSSGSRVVPCPRTDRDKRTSGWADRQMDETKLIFAFRNFTNALKNWPRYLLCSFYLNLSFRYPFELSRAKLLLTTD